MLTRANNKTIEVKHPSDVPTRGEIRRMRVEGMLTRTYRCVGVEGPRAHWVCMVDANVEVTA